MDNKLLLVAAVVVVVLWITPPAEGQPKTFTCPKTAYTVATQNTPKCPTRRRRALAANIQTQKTAADKLKADVAKLKSQLALSQRALQNALNLEKQKRAATATNVNTQMGKATAAKNKAATAVQSAKGAQANALNALKAQLQVLKSKVNALAAKAAKAAAAAKPKPSGSTGTKPATGGTGTKPTTGTGTGTNPSTGTGTKPSTGTGTKPTTGGSNPTTTGGSTGGATKPTHPQDCGTIHKQNPKKTSGLYSTKIPGQTGYVITYCDMDIDGGGWTVIQRRQAANPSFDRPWNDYKNGFGAPMGSFWWGLEKVYMITKGQNFKLRIELEDTQGLKKYAVYDNFRIDNESNKYKLTIGSYTGNAGNALMTHNGMKFSTKDQDNDAYLPDSCAKAYLGGWWYNDHCFDANLNGYYSDKNPTGASGFWLPFNGYQGVKSSTMMIRPMNYTP